MNIRSFFVAIVCCLFLGASFGAGASELTRVPSDIDLNQGVKEVVAKIDECKIQLKLSDREYFWTSPSYSDAVFYRPSGNFSKKKAPYFYKPEVETYSGVYWDYIKPKPYDEPWFGLRCTARTPELSTYVEANCPAQKKDNIWVLTEAAAKLPKVEIEEIEGRDWDGFVVSFESKTKGLRSAVFCAVGKKVLMGQSSYPVEKKGNLEFVKNVLKTIEFAD